MHVLRHGMPQSLQPSAVRDRCAYHGILRPLACTLRRSHRFQGMGQRRRQRLKPRAGKDYKVQPRRMRPHLLVAVVSGAASLYSVHLRTTPRISGASSFVLGYCSCCSRGIRGGRACAKWEPGRIGGPIFGCPESPEREHKNAVRSETKRNAA